MRLHCERRRNRHRAPRRVVKLLVRTRHAIPVAERPAVVTAILQDVDLFRWQVLVIGLDVVALVLGDPHLLRHGMHRDPDGIPKSRRIHSPIAAILVEAHHGGAVGRALDAYVARRADRDVHRTIRPERDGPTPVGTTATVRRHPLYVTRRLPVRAESHAHNAVRVRDVEGAAVKRESVRTVQARDCDDLRLGGSVTVRVHESDDLVTAGAADVHRAIGPECHESRTSDTREFVDDEPVGEREALLQAVLCASARRTAGRDRGDEDSYRAKSHRESSRAGSSAPRRAYTGSAEPTTPAAFSV